MFTSSTNAAWNSFQACLAAVELTGYTLVRPRWVCSDNGRSSLHRTDLPNPRCHTGNLHTQHACVKEGVVTATKGKTYDAVKVLL